MGLDLDTRCKSAHHHSYIILTFSSLHHWGHCLYQQDKCPTPDSIRHSFMDLCDQVARKLNVWTETLAMHYRLNCNKPKDGMTLVQLEEEFAIFMSQMWQLFLAPHLANSKISAHPLKKVVVHFENAATVSPSNGNCNGNKTVCIWWFIVYLCAYEYQPLRRSIHEQSQRAQVLTFLTTMVQWRNWGVIIWKSFRNCRNTGHVRDIQRTIQSIVGNLQVALFVTSSHMLILQCGL